MANVLAPPRPRATATGVLSQHDFSQSSGGTSTAALGGIQIVVEEELKGEDAKEERGGDDDNNNDSTTTTTNNNDNNTQESFTQQLLSMTQNNNELTQLGVDDDMYDDDEDDDDAGGSSQSQDYCHSPIAPIDPLTLPWGRLMPVGIGGGGGGSGHNDDGGIDNNYDNDEADEAPSRPSSSSSQQRGPTEMMPRPPTTWGGGGGYGTGVATRSRSPSLGGMAVESFSSASQHSPAPRIQFLGLKNLIPSDRFNEYVLGRSVKVRMMRKSVMKIRLKNDEWIIARIMTGRLLTSLVSVLFINQYLLSVFDSCHFSYHVCPHFFYSYIHNDDDNDDNRPTSPHRNWTRHNNSISSTTMLLRLLLWPRRNRKNTKSGGMNDAITSTPWFPTGTAASTASLATSKPLITTMTMAATTRHPTWRYSWRTLPGTAR